MNLLNAGLAGFAAGAAEWPGINQAGHAVLVGVRCVVFSCVYFHRTSPQNSTITVKREHPDSGGTIGML
jgi:hypothetical protein